MFKVKNLLIFSFLVIGMAQIFAQATKQSFGSSILSQPEIKKLFNDSVKKKFNIEYEIFRVYKYLDNNGQFYIVLTEKTDSIINNDTLHFKIKAFSFKTLKNGLEKKWEVNDFKMKQTNGNGEENAIWFWTKYCEFQDLDKDGLIDPLLVYGTTGTNDYYDGRIKILIYYKGQKSAIRHQNGVLDFERNTQVDETFYSLPIIIQEHVKKTMQKIMDNSHGIFPYGWQNAMKNQKTRFQEKQTGY